MKVDRRMAARLIAAAVLLLVGGALAHAQTQPQSSSPATPAPMKVGVLSVRQAIVSTAEGKQASAELQSRFTPQQTELENLRKQIEDLQNRMRTGGDKLSDEERARLQRQGELLTRQFQRKQDDVQEELNAAQGEVVDRIGRKLLDVVDRYARENGYAVILDSSAQNSPVVNFSNQVDITQDIIRLYDQAYPVKSAAPPAQQRPAQPPPRPPAQKPPQQ